MDVVLVDVVLMRPSRRFPTSITPIFDKVAPDEKYPSWWVFYIIILFKPTLLWEQQQYDNQVNLRTFAFRHSR